MTETEWSRRFPPPWSVEETEPCFIVRDADGHALAYVYFEEVKGRRVAAGRYFGRFSGTDLGKRTRVRKVLLTDSGRTIDAESELQCHPIGFEV